ncbi:hypothetical protein A2U01_0056103 [Trifolium medium]|uniref:Uncharacterized protein n=1 Tax=Trifolium medium TaxID=97028 RepID=A0A392RFG7_9FABA|nr:hypothetical protein [Trifolium medium]
MRQNHLRKQPRVHRHGGGESKAKKAADLNKSGRNRDQGQKSEDRETPTTQRSTTNHPESATTRFDDAERNQ